MTKIVTFLAEILLRDRIDLYCGESLAMSFCALVMFAALEFEDDDLRATAVFEHGPCDSRSGDCGRADAGAVRVAGNQNLVKFNPIPFILIG
jgi:hypothetical protein